MMKLYILIAIFYARVIWGVLAYKMRLLNFPQVQNYVRRAFTLTLTSSTTGVQYDRPCILVGNHHGRWHLDSFSAMLLDSVKIVTKPRSLNEWQNTVFIDVLTENARTIEKPANSPAFEFCQTEVALALSAGLSVFGFPEGKITNLDQGFTLGEFKTGLFNIAKKLDCMVQPFMMDPQLASNRVRLKFLECMNPRQYASGPVMARAVRNRMQEQLSTWKAGCND